MAVTRLGDQAVDGRAVVSCASSGLSAILFNAEKVRWVPVGLDDSQHCGERSCMVIISDEGARPNHAQPRWHSHDTSTVRGDDEGGC
ncbi:hypothetical protein PCANC_01019 [Puccinia coronata f. sp. avenae]|uniref:Uncharacterized protein n=1 Tax=Puccinia coronata f. sp. avenae TaxID=200324 RepID=A0A2N5SUM4_9BASI|nr:hypothetical protein PCASD_21466 [Puccinia coronata f. sp. avenae]PLW16959.1 hypothetical protein PCANC_13924 [Puccinia coronata f. sp. avenae]PLW49763.1 hypothetical protein PCASD_01625 [Puccinia coronata f. sp. avenae]PLW57835.1 hypothetical protein PCANC_01019 [Puccinia coronata f. sp. avenae]